MRYFLFFQKPHSVGNLQGEIVQLLVVQYVLKGILILDNGVSGCKLVIAC